MAKVPPPGIDTASYPLSLDTPAIPSIAPEFGDQVDEFRVARAEIPLHRSFHVPLVVSGPGVKGVWIHFIFSIDVRVLILAERQKTVPLPRAASR